MTSAADETPKVLVTPEQLVGYAIDNRYRLEGIVGGGGMGVVYRTRQTSLNREVAIKLLKIEDGNDRHRLERFRREIDIIAKLSHPNIVRVFDSGRDEALGLSYIVMELIDGVPLDEVMLGHQLDPALAIDIAREVLAALTDPHAMGIIHRDIKPANILVSARSDDTVGVKVVDFGIARGHGSGGSSKITTTGVVVGSPMYMAPEVARGEELDARTDLYSLGVLLYEMLTGDTPFRGSTPVAIMLRQAVDDPPSLADGLPDDFPIPELVELVDSMLAKDKRNRPADARAVLRALDAICVDRGMGRVRIDGSMPIVEALKEHRSRARPPKPAPDDENAGADPYSATQPWDTAEERPDSFQGWLVPEAVRTQLMSSGSVEHASAPAPGRRRTPLIVAAIVATVGLVAAAAIVHEDPVPRREEVRSSPSTSEAPAPPVERHGPPAPQVERGDAPAAGEEIDAPASQAQTHEPRRLEPELPAPRQQRQAKPSRPSARAPRPDAGSTKEPKVENLDWIRQK